MLSIASPLAPAEDVFAEARKQAELIEIYLRSAQCLSSTLADFEVYLQQQGREFLRLLAQGHLDLRAQLEAQAAGAKPPEVRGVDGVLRSYRRPSFRLLRMTFGRVEVPRLAYQAPVVEGLHPMDALLNLPEDGYSYGVRRLVAEGVAQNSFDDVVEQLKNSTGTDVHKRQVQELAARAAQDFDLFYATQAVNDTEDSGQLLVLTFDGKGIAMRREDLRPATRKAAEANANKLRKRLSKGEKRNRKRMAQVAAVYSVAPWSRTPADILHDLRPVRDAAVARPRPTNKRVWASVEQEPAEVIDAAFQEALRRDPERRRRWVVLVDGNETQLVLVQAAAAKAQVDVTIIVDFIHVLEYLWKASYSFHKEGTKEAEAWVHERLLWLLEGKSVSDIAAGMRRSATLRELGNDQRAAVDDCADYLLKYKTFIAYGPALRDGLPIATGVIEGACRYLVKDRMDRTGARWSLQGAEAVLRLRALHASGAFSAYWSFHMTQEYLRNHLARYADGYVPLPLAAAATRTPLRRVK